MKSKNYNSNNFEKLKEEADAVRMNNYSENKDLFEGMEDNKKIENNLTGQIEDPSSPNGSTGSSEKNKNTEINKEKIEDKNVNYFFYPTPKENEKKINENSKLEIKDKSEKVKICKTPKENEVKMNEDSIEKKKEAISLNNVKSDEKNMYLLGHKEPVEPFNILIDSDNEDDIDMKNDNDDNDDNDDQLINFSIIAKINVNQKGYEGKGEDSYSLPIEDDDKLKSSCLSKILQIQSNHWK